LAIFVSLGGGLGQGPDSDGASDRPELGSGEQR